MEIAARGTVVEGQKGTRQQSCAFPSICALPDGRWICGFRAAPTKGATIGQHAMIAWSDDRGASWTEPVSPFNPQPVDGKPGLFRSAYLTSLGGAELLAALCWVDHSDADLPFFNEETEGLLDTRVFLTRSGDGGESWSEPVLMNTSPFNVPTPPTGPILLLPNREWACQFELNKHYYEPTPWHHSSVLMFSRDEGQTWPEHTIASSDPENRFFYWDQRPGALSSGRLLDLFWTYDNREGAYCNIHARESSDNGRTWSAMWDTGVPGQPAQPVGLPDGRIAMVYVDRTAEPTIKARVSEDRGRTWPDATESFVYQPHTGSQTEEKTSMQDAWREMSRFSVGLPATASLEDDEILVVYYAGPSTDCTNVEWALLRQ